MVNQNDDIPQPVISALVASGFPFQTAVVQMVKQLEDWKVVAEEFPWRDDVDADQFLDAVATNGVFTVTIECNKTQKEKLTFLQPEPIGGSSALRLSGKRYLGTSRFVRSLVRIRPPGDRADRGKPVVD